MGKPVLVIFRRLDELSDSILKHPGVEAVLPDAVAIYGRLDGSSFVSLDDTAIRSDLNVEGEDPRDVREFIALRMLGSKFTLDTISSKLEERIPVFTNTREDHVASLLLAPHLCRAICEQVVPPAKTLLAVFPSETRLFWSPIDTPEIQRLLARLSAKARSSRTVRVSLPKTRVRATRRRPAMSSRLTQLEPSALILRLVWPQALRSRDTTAERYGRRCLLSILIRVG